MERSHMVANVNEGDDGLIGLPPGFRFHPTDEEIVTHYLTPKVLNRSFTASAIGEADLNKSEPWDLPKKAKMGEKEWFFFFQRDRKYPTGMRTNRATESGYWKATGKDKEIFRPVGNLVGMKKTLVFYKGRAPRGEKTNWVMHEFRLEGKFSYYNMPTPSEDEWVVCRVFHKNTGTEKSPNHELNSFVEELLDGPSMLPPLTDPSALKVDPSFDTEPYYFYDGQPEILQKEDYKNTIASSYNYNFNTIGYQANSYMNEHQYKDKNVQDLASGSVLYWPNMSLKKENENVDRYDVDRYILTTNQHDKISISQDTDVSTDMTNTETTSTSKFSKYGLKTRDCERDDHVGTSTFSDLDSLLEY
ncbi:hypothetical protein L2E82_28627 [Cichorium intybus]|uniref:Uncharacterized protein n=1 Tax=Cichorium intybus TaxID=13427 RepID=A0ACB9CWK6_CICIN|nr:hypothetical protein L2E82_28627 [Cichorium intybus]